MDGNEDLKFWVGKSVEKLGKGNDYLREPLLLTWFHFNPSMDN